MTCDLSDASVSNKTTRSNPGVGARAPLRHGRPPGPVGRMIARRSSAVEENPQRPQPQVARVDAAATAPTRVSVRVAVPDRMLRMTEFGLRFVGDERQGSGWWTRVEDRMERLVAANLPVGARSVEMAIDSETLEVVLEFEPPRPRAHLSICR